MSAGNPITSFLMKVFVRVKAIMSTELNISALREKNKAKSNTVVRVEIFEDRAFTRPVYVAQYMVTDAGIKEVDRGIEPNAVSKTDYNTIVSLIKGERDWVYQGKKFSEPYNYIQAWSEGRVVITKTKDVDSYIPDMALFEELYETILPRLKDSLGKYL